MRCGLCTGRPQDTAKLHNGHGGAARRPRLGVAAPGAVGRGQQTGAADSRLARMALWLFGMRLGGGWR